jgi:uncharacterized protein (TIGR00106 family)
LKSKNQNHVIAEISVTPIGTKSTSVGEQVGAALHAISKIKGIKFELNAMGTILVSDNMDKIFLAVKAANEAILGLGEKRVSTILKIDNRIDKVATLQSKVDSAKKRMRS